MAHISVCLREEILCKSFHFLLPPDLVLQQRTLCDVKILIEIMNLGRRGGEGGREGGKERGQITTLAHNAGTHSHIPVPGIWTGS